MNYIYVGIGDYVVSRDSEVVIRTMALGSCVAIIIRDLKTNLVTLGHIALPDSSINARRALEKPASFADTGIHAMLTDLRLAGYSGNGSLEVKLAGGASILDPNNTFNIGKRNLLAIRRCLWQHKLGAIAEHVGGNISRNVSVEVATGKTIIASPGKGSWIL
ncbi:chemotaxis protein CheD [bacterium]|nr:chemotaxis protein CheD [bacterium]